MTTCGLLLAVLVLFVAVMAVPLWDVIRQTRSYSAREANGSIQFIRSQPAKRIALAAGWDRWTALDDLQLARMLDDDRCR